MRRTSFLLITVFASLSLHSWGANKKKTWEDLYSLGLQLGMNISFANTTPPASSTASTRQGLLIGGQLEIPIRDGYFLQPEFRYTEKGGNTTLLGVVPGNVQLNYLEPALLFKRKWRSERWMPYAFVGPTLGIAITRQVQVLGVVPIDLSSRFSSFDLCLEAGGGIQYLISSTISLFLQGRLSLGLFDLDSNQGGSYASRMIAFQVGIATPL